MNGTLFESPSKFPSGMRALSEWMHTRGLKLGVYSDRGTHDFSGAGLGMAGHEVQDANTFADWGVDYLKVDDMSGEESVGDISARSVQSELL
jgi:alpha-galactosidase